MYAKYDRKVDLFWIPIMVNYMVKIEIKCGNLRGILCKGKRKTPRLTTGYWGYQTDHDLGNFDSIDLPGGKVYVIDPLVSP